MKLKYLVSITIYTILITTLFTGCMGIKSSDTELQTRDNLYLSSDKSIAYAYINNDQTLEYITFKYEEPKNGLEVIHITNNGFYPDYTMKSNVENGSTSGGCLVKNSEKENINKFCKSAFTERTILGSGVSAIWNAGATLTTVGLNVATGAIVDPKFFNKDKFLTVVKSNNLNIVRNEIKNLMKLQNVHNSEINDLYNTEYNKYKENAKNIVFKYIYNDKSGLLYDKKPNPNLQIRLLDPYKTKLNYSTLYQNETFNSISSFKLFFEKLSINLNNNLSNVKIEYTNKYSLELKDYSFYIGNNDYLTFNKDINFHGNTTIPKNLLYKNGVKQTIPVYVNINSVSINVHGPDSFILNDQNVKLDFKNPSKKNVIVIAENKTKSFLTLKSLTSYYNSDVYTFSNNVDKELAPQSVTLDSNSSYELFSEKMTKNMTLSKITRNNIQDKYLDYGFAVKYHIQDSNIEKTIYEKKKYSYLELYKNQLK